MFQRTVITKPLYSIFLVSVDSHGEYPLNSQLQICQQLLKNCLTENSETETENNIEYIICLNQSPDIGQNADVAQFLVTPHMYKSSELRMKLRPETKYNKRNMVISIKWRFDANLLGI